ncbi:MAG: hypothetical protein ABSH14_03050 [Verrucomicrobiia bacterium]|jgi:hypothetical protein
MFEHRHERLLPRRLFFRRLARHGCLGLGIVAVSLGVGVLGYHLAEGLGWLDSFLNASMILGGMGPVNELHHDAGKWFASLYALFSGVMFLVMCGVIFAPVVHRFLHKFHLDIESKSK